MGRRKTTLDKTLLLELVISQKLDLAPELDIAANLFLGHEPLTVRRTLDDIRTRREAGGLLAGAGMKLEASRPGSSLRKPKRNLVAVQPVDGIQAKAVTVFGAMLQAHPDLKVIYASNDPAAADASIAARQVGNSGQVKIIGTDSLPGPSSGIRAVAYGEWAATMVHPTGTAMPATSKARGS